MNLNNSIIYFLFGIIILSIIILILLIFESDINETNLNEINETNIQISKGSCPIHNPKVLQIGLGTVGLSGILLLTNKYFNIKSGGKSKSLIKKGKIKKLISGSNIIHSSKLIFGSNPVDPNFILDETYIGNKINRLKEENIQIIKLLKYINIIELSDDMNYYYRQENNQSILILNEYKKEFISNKIYPKLKECYKKILKERVNELKKEINSDLLTSVKFRQELEKSINKGVLTKFNEDVFNRQTLKENQNKIINKLYKGNILNDNIFITDINNSFETLNDLGINNFSSYKTRLQEIYKYNNRLENINGSAPRSKFDKLPKSKTELVDNKLIKQKISDEQKEEFTLKVNSVQIEPNKKEEIVQKINQIEIQNIDKNPIYLYPENLEDNIITDLNNKQIKYEGLLNEFLNYNILKDEYISYEIMFTNCTNETIGHIEIMSEYIYDISYKLFKLFIRNSCEYFELNTKNDKCKTCFTLINSELSLLRNQLNQSIKNYNTMNQKNKELEKLNLQLSEQNVEFNNKIESLEQTKDEYINNNAELKVEIKNLNEVIYQNNVTISELKQKNTELSNNNVQQQQKIQDLDKKIQDLNNLNDQSNSEIKKLNFKIIDNNEKIENLNNNIIELKQQNKNKINEIEELKEKQINEIKELRKQQEIEIDNLFLDYKNNLNQKEQKYNEQLEEKTNKLNTTILELSTKNNNLEDNNAKLLDENNKLKRNVSLSNEVSDTIINTISTDIQSILDIINKYKTQIVELNKINKTSINEFKKQFINNLQNNYIKINESDYKNILEKLKSYLDNLENLDELTELSNKKEKLESDDFINDTFTSESDNSIELYNRLPMQLIKNLKIQILENIDSIKNNKLDESNQAKGKLIRKITQENSDIDFNLKLQNKKDILLNNLKEFNSLINENDKKFNKTELEIIIKELNKEKYFNNSTQLLQDLDKLKVYNDDNIYNLNIFTEFISKYSEDNQLNIKNIEYFKNSYITNYGTNIILQIKLYSQIIILNKIFKFVSSLIDSLKRSPLNLAYFNDKLNKLKFNSKYQFNTIIGNNDNRVETSDNISNTNSTETLTYNDLVDNILKLLEVSNITETELDIDIPIKYSDVEEQLLDNKFKTVNQHLTGFMNLLMNKITNLEIIKDKESILNDIIYNSNNLINNINNKYQNEITRLSNELDKQNMLNKEFNKNINDIFGEYEKIIIKGYNNFITYGKDNKSQIEAIIQEEIQINTYNKIEFFNKKKEILQKILIIIKSNSDTEFLIENINPITNNADLFNLLIEFDIYIDILLELNNKFIEQILDGNKLLIDENKQLNKQINKLEIKIINLEKIQSQSTEIEKLNNEQKKIIAQLESTVAQLQNENNNIIQNKKLNDLDYKILEEFKTHINNMTDNLNSITFNYTEFKLDNLDNTNKIIQELINTYNSKIIKILSTYQSQKESLEKTIKNLKLAIEDNEKSFIDYQNQIKDQNEENNILFNFFNKIKNLFSTSKDITQDSNESLNNYINKIYNFIEQEINKINQELKKLQDINNIQNEDYQQKILQLKQNINEIISKNIALQNLVEQKNKEIESLTTDNNMLNDKYNILSKQIELLKIEYNKKIQELFNSNQQELNNKIQDLSSIREELQKLKNEKSNIITKLNSSDLILTQIDNNNLSDIINNLIDELKQNKINIKKLTSLNEGLNNSTIELTKLNTELINKHKLEINELNNSKEELNNKLTEEINKLKTDRTNKNINIVIYKTKIEILENAKIKLLTENNELSDKIVNLENQLIESNKKIKELEEKQQKSDEIIVENSLLDSQIDQLNSQITQLTLEKEKSLKELEKELKILKDEISNENIQKENNINVLKEIIKKNTLLVIQLNIKNQRLNEQILKLQNENEDYKKKQLEMIKEKELNNRESITKYKELENKYNLNLNELGLIKEIIRDYKMNLSEALSNNKLTIEEKEKLAIEIIKLKQANLLLNEELNNKTKKIEQDTKLLEQQEDIINKKLIEIEELKNRIKNINNNRLNELKNKENEIKNKENELKNLIKQHEIRITKIKDDNIKLEIDLRKQIINLSQENKQLTDENTQLTNINTKLTNELNNLQQLFDIKIQDLLKQLFDLQIQNGTLKTTIDELNKEIKRCEVEKKNNLLLSKQEINLLTDKLNECDKLKDNITNTLNNKITELNDSNNNNLDKDKQIKELTRLLNFANLDLEKKKEEFNKMQLELNAAHSVAITNLTNEFDKIKEKINIENLENNQKLILDLNTECYNKIKILDDTIIKLTIDRTKYKLDVESKIEEINKLKELYKVESEKLKKQNIIYYFKNLTLSNKIKNLNNTIEKLKNDNIINLTNKENIINELNKELDRITNTLTELETEINITKNINNKFIKELEECKNELNKCTTSLNECTTKLNNCNNDRNLKENRIEQYKNELGIKETIIKQIQKDKQALEERLNELNIILSKTPNDKISKLSQENQQLVKENENLKDQIKSIKSSTITYSMPVNTSISTIVNKSSLPPVIDEYAYYSTHPYITKRSNKLLENIYGNDPYSKFIKKSRNE